MNVNVSSSILYIYMYGCVYIYILKKPKCKMFYEERPRLITIPVFPSSRRNEPEKLLENSPSYKSNFASVAMYPTLVCWAKLVPLTV